MVSTEPLNDTKHGKKLLVVSGLSDTVIQPQTSLDLVQIQQQWSMAHGAANKPKYTKTEDITVTKTDPSLLIFGGGNFQMKWAKKQVSNTWTHFHHIFIKM